MGSICAGQGVISVVDATKKRSNISHKLERSMNGIPDKSDDFFREYKLDNTPVAYGEHGEVWLCTKIATGNLFIVKIVDKLSLPYVTLEENSIFRLFEKLKSITSANLVKYYEIIEDRSAYYVVMEYISGGDLYDFMGTNGRLSEPQAAKIILQVLLAAIRLQASNLSFNDIKPENILFYDSSNFSIKFNSLNLWSLIEEVSKDSVFLSPEAAAGKSTNKCDSWSIGVIMYYLLSGEIPSQIPFSITKIPTAFLSSISMKACNLLNGLLQPDINSRISLKDAINHNWILAHCASEEFEITHN